jgi:signal transduction histidine kinase
MSEATRLEQAIEQEDLETFNIIKVIDGCVQGYQHAYARRKWTFISNDNSLLINGSPELIAQLFDKIVSNAVDFSKDNDEIIVKLEKQDKSVRLSVSNPGPLLPKGMKSQLTQSMVSVRKENDVQNATNSPHLGLGLYIANMITTFHKGQLLLNDREDDSGVIVTVSLPL